MACALAGGLLAAGPVLADDNEKLSEVLVSGSRVQSSVPLDQPSLTGSRLDIPLRDLPASISVISQDLIQQRGARTALEAIQAAVGMSGGTSVGSIPTYSTRGFTGNDLTVMRDGIRQNTSSQSARPLDAFLFDRVEVLKGPASLLYGEGAIGGAVNYVSKSPSRTFSGEANVSGGSWDTRRIAAGAGGPLGASALSFRADASYSDSQGYVDRSDYEYKAYGAALGWDVAEHTKLTLYGTYLIDDSRSYYGTPVVYDAVIDQNGVQKIAKANTATDRLVNARIEPATRQLNYNNPDNFAFGENSFWRAVLETQISENWSLRNEAYLATQLLHWRNTESYVWNPVTRLVDRSSFLLIYRDDNEIGDRLDLTWHRNFGGMDNRFLVGALYDRNDQIRNSGQSNYVTTPTPLSVALTGFDPGFGPVASEQKTANIIVNTAAVYIEDVLAPTAALKLVAGVRYDSIDVTRISFVGAARFDKSYHPFTGRLGVVYDLTPDWNVYASYSRAAQPVSQLVSLTVAQNDFSLQTGRQFELGSKASFLDKRADVTLALFDIQKNDLLTSTLVNGVRFNSQIGAQVSQGAELAASVGVTRTLRIDANLAWTWKAEFKDFFENLGSGVISRAGNTPPNVPKVVAGIFVAKEFGRLSATLGAQYVGERQANNNNGIQMPAYTTLDASLSYQWDRLTISLRGRNLTDETYADLAAGSGLMQHLGDPRSAELGLRYRF
jgi:iron complex outermembrane receptor protein